jgi:hypothetical protein
MTKAEWDIILSLVGTGLQVAKTNPQVTADELTEVNEVVDKFIAFVEDEKDAT